MFKKLYLIFGTIVLSFGVLFVFFGGTWEGVEFILQLLGTIWIFQTCYNVLVEVDRKEKVRKENAEILNKHFNETS